jgi:transposase
VSRFQVLSDAQWSLIGDLLPKPTGRQGRPFSDARRLVEGIAYRYRTGIAWRDVPGLPLVVLLTTGQAGDSPMFGPLMAHLRAARPVAGRAPVPTWSALTRPTPRARSAAIYVSGVATYKGRNVIERRFCHLKQWRGLATRYDKLALTYRAAAVLNAMIAWTRRLSDMP